MKPRAIIIVTILMLLTVALTSNAFAQGIIWRPYGLRVDSTPGKATACTLRFYISPGNQLTQGDYIKIDLSDFQVDATKSGYPVRYSFDSESSTQSIHMDSTSDYDVTYSTSSQELTISLTGENALFPADTNTIIIDNKVLTHLGTGSNRNGTYNTDVLVRVKTSKQQVYAPSTQTTTITLDTYNDESVTAIVPADTNAQEYTRYTITGATDGKMPAGGKFSLIFPYGTTFSPTGKDTQDVEVYVGGVKKPISDAAFADSTVTVTMTNEIADGSTIEIRVGTSDWGNNIVRNPSLFPYTGSSYENKKTFSGGTGFVLIGMDDVNDTLFCDKGTTPATFDILSNWWPADTDSGGVYVSVSTANKATEGAFRFKLGAVLDSVNTSNVDTLYIDLSAFNVTSANASKDKYFTIKGISTVSDTNDFNATYKANDIIAITPSARVVFPAEELFTLVVSNSVLKNYGAVSDFDVKIWTSRQAEELIDRDVTKIFANTGGIITGLTFNRYDAGEPATIDSLLFVTNGEIPSDGFIVIKLPNQFSLPTSISKAKVYGYEAIAGTRTLLASITGGEISALTGTYLQDNEIRLKLDLSGLTIPTDSTLLIMVGDSTGFGSQNTALSEACTLPVAADSGTYPTITAGRDYILIETRNANETAIQTGSNENATVRVYTNYFMSDSLGLTTVSASGAASAATHLRSWGTLYSADTVTAGDSVGLWARFVPGRDILGDPGLSGDTVYVDFSDFIVDPEEADEPTNFAFKVINPAGNGAVRGFADASRYLGNGVVAIWSDASVDSLAADSVVELITTPSGQATNESYHGLLNAKGTGIGNIQIWTSNQPNTKITSTTPIVINPDTMRIVKITMPDSAANEDNYPTISIAYSHNMFPDNGSIKITLYDKFSWNSSNISEGNLSMTNSADNDNGVKALNATDYDVSAPSDQVFTIALTDTIYRRGLNHTKTYWGDTLTITLGGSGTEFMKNIHPDSIFGAGYGRKRVFGPGPSIGASNDEIFKIDIYDANSNLVATNHASAWFGGGSGANHTQDSVAIVTNAFTKSIFRVSQANDTDHMANLAGNVIDSLYVPFEIGRPLHGGGTISFKFYGLVLADPNVTESEIQDSTLWYGDQIGMASPSDVDNDFTANQTITYTLEAGDTLGVITIADSPIDMFTPYMDTVVFRGLFRNKGLRAPNSGGSLTFEDTVDCYVEVYTSVQTTAVADTTILENIPYTNTVAGLPASSTAGASVTPDFTFGADNHPHMHPNSQIKIGLPIGVTDSTQFFTELLSTGTISPVTSYVFVDTGISPNRDTIDNISAEYSKITTGAVDSGYITIDLGNNYIRSSSVMRVLFKDSYTAPLKATTGTDLAAPFSNNNPSTGGFRYTAQLLDESEEEMHYAGPNGLLGVGAGTASKVLLLVKGERFAPGTATGKFTPNGVSLTDTVGTDMNFALAVVDGNYNIAAPASDVNVTLTSPTDVYAWIKRASDGNYFVDAYTLKLTAGHPTYVRSVYAADADSFKYMTAKDNNSNLGRSGYQQLKATYTGGLSGNVTSSNHTVYPGDMVKTIGMFPSTLASYYTPGDSANKGIDPGAVTPELAEKGIYTLTAFAVDSFYNRVDTTGAGVGDDFALSAARVSGVSMQITPKTTYTDAYGKQEFSVKALATGNGNVIRVSSADLGGSANYTVTFNVAAAVASADFTLSGTYSLPDSTSTHGTELEFQVRLSYSGTYGDYGWKFYAYPDSGETNLDPGDDGVVDVHPSDYVQKGENGVAINHKDTVGTKYFTENQKYFIYAVLPQQGYSVVNQSKGFVVRHHPWVVEDSTYGGRVINPNAAPDTINSNTSVEKTIDFRVLDYNSSNVEIDIYYSTDGTLSKGDIEKGGAPGTYTIDGLTGAELLATKTKEDSTALMTIADLTSETVNIAAGNYYMYVVATDKKHFDIAQSDYRLTVKHSPYIGGTNLVLDRPVAGTTPHDTKDKKYLTVNWSKSGDKDLDDNAYIAIYYDKTEKNHTRPIDLINSTTAVQLTNGFELREETVDANGREIDQYVVDLTALSAADLPEADSVYDFYALIKDNVDTVLAKSAGDVQFAHSPEFEFLFNFGGGAVGKSGKASFAKQVTINKGDVYRFSFDSYDLDQSQYIRIVVSQVDNADYDNFNFGTDAWIVNSTNGEDGDAKAKLLRTGTDQYINWYSGDMTGLSNDGDYYVYAFVTNNGLSANTNWNNANTDKFTAEGTVRILGTDYTSEEAPSVRFIPDVVSTNKADTIHFDIMANTKGEQAQIVSFFINVDTSEFTIVDQGNGVNIKPFGYGTGYFGQGEILEDTVLAAGGNTLWLNFKRFHAGGITTSGDSAIAYLKLVSKGTDSVTTLDNSIEFVMDLANDRRTGLVDGSDYLNITLPSPAIKFYTNPLGMITGRVPLEGRIYHTKEVTIELRRPGSLTAESDVDFIEANDENGNTADGIQIYTERDGYYELKNVPTGSWDIVAKAESYLSGQYQNVSVVPGDIEVGIDPLYDNDAIPVLHDYLIAGDCASSDGDFLQDNYVSDWDLSCITTYHDNPAYGYSMADINGDGSVDEDDLMLVLKNQGIEGVPPVFYVKGSASSNINASIEVAGIPEIVGEGTEFEVEVYAKNVDDLFGYSYKLIYDNSKVELLPDGIVETGFLKSNDRSALTLFFTKEVSGGKDIISGLRGRKETATGTGVITVLKFRSLGNERPDIRLVDAKVFNSDAKPLLLGDIVDVPDEFGLRQNYPNPFNPITTISFKMPHTAKVSLKVYNILGQEIATLLNKTFEAGYHSIKWDGRNHLGIKVASGMYIYRIKAGDYIASKKMVLMK